MKEKKSWFYKVWYLVEVFSGICETVFNKLFMSRFQLFNYLVNNFVKDRIPNFYLKVVTSFISRKKFYIMLIFKNVKNSLNKNITFLNDID